MIAVDNICDEKFTVSALSYTKQFEWYGCEMPYSSQFNNFIRAILGELGKAKDETTRTMDSETESETESETKTESESDSDDKPTVEYRLTSKKYQEIVCKFMTMNREINIERKSLKDIMYQTPYRGVLVYHDMGVGKTFTAAHSAYNFIINYRIPLLSNKTIEKDSHIGKVYILFYRRIRQNWHKQLHDYLTKFVGMSSDSADKFVDDHIEQIYSDPTKDRVDKIMRKHALDHNMVIIDEAHNVMSYIYNALKTNSTTSNGYHMYRWLMEAQDIKLIFLSGTPIVNDIYELAIMLNLLRGIINDPYSDKQYTLFGQYDKDNHLKWIDNDFCYQNLFESNGTILNRMMFQKRIAGLVSRKRLIPNDYARSYWTKETPLNEDEDAVDEDAHNPDERFRYRLLELPTANVRIVYSKMSETQFREYEISKKKETKVTNRPKNTDDKSIKPYVKSHGNCTFPLDGDKIYELPGIELTGGSYLRSQTTTNSSRSMTISSSGDFDSTTTDTFSLTGGVEDGETDEETDADLEDTIDEDEAKRLADVKEFDYNLDNLSEVSPKLSKIVDSITDPDNDEIHFVYSRYIVYSIFHLEAYLIQKGFREFKYDDTKSVEKYNDEAEKNGVKHYLKYTNPCQKIVNRAIVSVGKTAGSDDNTMKAINEIMNHEFNKNGKIIKVLLGTNKAKEGINLMNVRHVHVVEPWWNMIHIMQAIGRAFRFQSHKDFKDKDDQYVKVDLHVCRLSQDQEFRMAGFPSTDELILDVAMRKMDMIKGADRLVADSSIDCGLYDDDDDIKNSDDTSKTLLVAADECVQYFNPRDVIATYQPDIYSDLTDNVFRLSNKQITTEYIRVNLTDGPITRWLEANDVDPTSLLKTSKNELVDIFASKSRLPAYILYKNFGQTVLPLFAFVKEDKQYKVLKYPQQWKMAKSIIKR